MKRIEDLRVLIDRIPYAEGNIGEEAILASLLQDLQACGVRNVAVLSNQPERTQRRHGDRVKVITDEPKRWLTLPLMLRSFDLLVWGGGHMLQDRSSQLYIPYVVKTLLLGRLLRRPRFIYAPGLGPVVAQFGRTLSRWALNDSKTIIIRDEGSNEFLKSIGIVSQVEKTADPAFSLAAGPGDAAAGSEDRPPVIGFAPRRLFYRKGSVLPVSWQLAAQREGNRRFEIFLQNAAAVLDLMVERHGAEVRLIPMDIGPNPRDDLICRRLRGYVTHADKALVQDDDPPLAEFIRRLSELDVLVSARLHGIILGLRYGLPFIGIDSDGKIPQLTKSLGMDDFVIRDADFERDRFLDRLQQALDSRRELREQLLGSNSMLTIIAQKNCHLLEQCLKSLIEAE